MLAAIGQPLQESEIVSYILAGVSADRLWSTGHLGDNQTWSH